MKELLFYYFLNSIFYIFEIVLFKYFYLDWPLDIFWLNTILRGTLSIFFSILVRKTVFKDSKNFYLKFFVIALINPLASSTSLKVLMFYINDYEAWILKIIGDLFISLIAFILLKK
tara:strand:- start:103 stop:450 length:348 start_codon:yes stop_codon:yes gene_type:complete